MTNWSWYMIDDSISYKWTYMYVHVYMCINIYIYSYNIYIYIYISTYIYIYTVYRVIILWQENDKHRPLGRRFRFGGCFASQGRQRGWKFWLWIYPKKKPWNFSVSQKNIWTFYGYDESQWYPMFFCVLCIVDITYIIGYPMISMISHDIKYIVYCVL